jgi:hypothetical protein
MENAPRGPRPGFRRYQGLFPQPSHPLFDQLIVYESGRLWVRAAAMIAEASWWSR